jgi:hypothetical protein
MIAAFLLRMFYLTDSCITNLKKTCTLWSTLTLQWCYVRHIIVALTSSEVTGEQHCGSTMSLELYCTIWAEVILAQLLLSTMTSVLLLRKCLEVIAGGKCFDVTFAQHGVPTVAPRLPMKMKAFWDIAPCTVVRVDRCFRGANYPIIRTVVEAVRTFRTCNLTQLTLLRNRTPDLNV